MGEYATFNGQRIKIGTCEQMYYLRADQVKLVQPLDGNVNPHSIEDAGSIRFRFPFPQEDHIKPGAFEDYDYGLGLWGIEPPEDIEHYKVQFVRSYPTSGGILVSLPCPRSKEGKAGIKVAYNGYSGSVLIHSQRLVDGQLQLVLRCGDCGALYRVTTLEECRDVLESLDRAAKEKDSADFYNEIARRVKAGYTEPNFWTPILKPAEAVAA